MKKNNRDFFVELYRNRKQALAGDVEAQALFQRGNISLEDLRTLSDDDFILRVCNADSALELNREIKPTLEPRLLRTRQAGSQPEPGEQGAYYPSHAP
jgi:hypothetical protein